MIQDDSRRHLIIPSRNWMSRCCLRRVLDQLGTDMWGGYPAHLFKPADKNDRKHLGNCGKFTVAQYETGLSRLTRRFSLEASISNSCRQNKQPTTWLDVDPPRSHQTMVRRFDLSSTKPDGFEDFFSSALAGQFFCLVLVVNVPPCLHHQK